MKASLPPLDFLLTLEQRRQLAFRRQWRLWTAIAALGAVAAAAPIALDLHLRGEARARLAALRASNEARAGERAAFDATARALSAMVAHRRAAVTLVEQRQSVAPRLLDVMRACADGVRLTSVKSGGDHLRIEGYATTQSRVRETQKRLRALPWVRKVAEVESSVVPESVRRQWADADTSGPQPEIRRFTLRIEPKPSPRPAARGVDTVDEWSSEEVADVR
ncbi:PilN domain-containing protein [Pandoraea nosoerga]|uniref:PilN domain-containing protein n=1 Tax=Pandoraea nosoerga TaxID=2508296 RepID=UPI001980D9B2|nr:PilN domain-containing protein [Pandoraea nosoerga]MBN4666819.1 PilN domain-containing protein [Pandoraea nosoerga]MBN4677554.1 PilN domain-containing protein [Pandoraea nosoerga]MBN4682396.1 PilN domain-containing protein [Pandoraea nosoerga]